MKGHASRGNYSKLKFKIIQKFLLGGAPVRTLSLGSALRAEIFQNLYKIKQNRHALRGNYSKLIQNYSNISEGCGDGGWCGKITGNYGNFCLKDLWEFLLRK